jgi:uncharacterized protein (DUF2236 family)
MMENGFAVRFGPHSAIWKIARENFLMLGGPRALLLQLAHPKVAAGVADHSGFRRDPLAPFVRLYTTGDTMQKIVFGTPRQAEGAVTHILGIHDRVHGKTREKAGPVPRGSPYTAHDPALLTWVMATLYETSVDLYERWLAPLPAKEKEEYYRDWRALAGLLGATPRAMPPNVRAFEAYYRRMLKSGLGVGGVARELSRTILNPPLTARPLAEFNKLVTTGLLPGEVREMYDLPWGAVRQTAFDFVDGAMGRAIPRWPAFIRYSPYWVVAELQARLGGLTVQTPPL